MRWQYNEDQLRTRGMRAVILRDSCMQSNDHRSTRIQDRQVQFQHP